MLGKCRACPADAPARPLLRDGLCASHAELERLKGRRDFLPSLNDIDLEGVTMIARMRDEALTTVRRWSKDYDACRGWGVGDDHHGCDNRDPKAVECDAGRCYRCSIAHTRWETMQRPNDTAPLRPAAITPTVPTPAPATNPAPTVADAPPFTPRAWAKHYDRCVQCGRDDREAGPRGLCLTSCYPAAQKAGYTGNIGPKTLKAYTDAENRALVDAYLATINRPTDALATPAPTTEATPLISDAVSGVTPPITPPTITATPVVAAPVALVGDSRTVADELRALLDGLARERAALEEERHRVNARLEELRCQVGAVETTIALVAR